ncbi:MAG: C-GCAxxG-C-C family protein [Proteobacteria bacterium]|nr:C-GCAxxG-C-C family protein [Pseudomonadota bacterium]
MQGLQELWGLPVEEASWATGGYSGAISSGRTTCGLLIGSGAAIGLRCGREATGRPEDEEDRRTAAVKGVGRLYRAFLQEFGDTDCRTLTDCDFSSADEVGQYMANKTWEKKCDVFLRFVFDACRRMAEDGKI